MGDCAVQRRAIPRSISRLNRTEGSQPENRDFCGLLTAKIHNLNRLARERVQRVWTLRITIKDFI
jgi:hypothetical protein